MEHVDPACCAGLVVPAVCRHAGMLTNVDWEMWLCWTLTASHGGAQPSAAPHPAPGKALQLRTMLDTWSFLVRRPDSLMGHGQGLAVCQLRPSRAATAENGFSAVLLLSHGRGTACVQTAPTSNGITFLHDARLPCSGGHASAGRTNDLLLLELSGWTWSQPVTTGTAPSPRSGSALCIGHGRYLVIHGGRNNFLLDSAHVLDLMTRTWVDVSEGSWAGVTAGLHSRAALTVVPRTALLLPVQQRRQQLGQQRHAQRNVIPHCRLLSCLSCTGLCFGHSTTPSAWTPTACAQ
jgi:hypothetical protein